MNTLFNKNIKESGLEKLMKNTTIKNALERLLQLSKTLSPEEQKELSVKLSKIPLTKSTATTQAKSLARKGGYFEAKKEKEEEAPKEKDKPVQSYEKNITGNQHFRMWLTKLKNITDPEERAESVKRLLALVPKQNDKYKYALRRFLEASKGQKKSKLKERSIWQDPNAPVYADDNPAYDGDSWSENFFRESGFFDVLELATDIKEEVDKKATRGTIGGYGEDVSDLIAAMKVISDEFLVVQKDMEKLVKDWKIS